MLVDKQKSTCVYRNGLYMFKYTVGTRKVEALLTVEISRQKRGNVIDLEGELPPYTLYTFVFYFKNVLLL